MERGNIVVALSKAGLAGKYGEPGDHHRIEICVRDRYRCVYCGTTLLDDIIRMFPSLSSCLLAALREDVRFSHTIEGRDEISTVSRVYPRFLKRVFRSHCSFAPL